MAEPSYGKIFPFEGAQEAGDAEWRFMGKAYGDGIVNDPTGDSFGIASKSSSDRSFVVTLGEYRIQGINFVPLEASVTLTPSAPSGANKRADRVVAKYDLGAKTVTVELDSSGTAVTGTPVPPSLTRNPVDDWVMPLWVVSGGSGPASGLTFADQRMWAGGVPFVVASASVLQNELTDISIGSVAYAADTGHEWRKLRVGGAALWQDMDGPTWLTLNLPSSVAAGSPVPAYTRARGVVYMRGTWVRPGGVVFQSGGGTGGVFSMGRLPAGYRPSQAVTWIADRTGAGVTSVTLIVQPDGNITARVQGDTNAIASGGGAFLADGTDVS